MKAKIVELQALRGVAILMVMAFHFGVRWDSASTGAPTLYPFADLPALARVVLSQGRLGVQLFFMISGFVIALTLENSAGLADFWRRRFARLWPPLLVCLPLVWMVLQVAPPFEASGKSLGSLLVSFTLINPMVLGLGANQQVTGVLWTLWAEIQFYLLASVLFFRFRSLSRGLLAGSLLGTILMIFQLTPYGVVVQLFFRFFNLPGYLPWFAAGVVFYAVRRDGWTRGRVAALLGCFTLSSISLGVFELLFDSNAFQNGIAQTGLLVNLVFFGVFSYVARPCRATIAALSWPPMVTLGAISYELYLIHEVLGLSLLQWLRVGTEMRGPWLALATVVVVTPVAWAIYRWWSVPAMRVTRRWLGLPNRQEAS